MLTRDKETEGIIHLCRPFKTSPGDLDKAPPAPKGVGKTDYRQVGSHTRTLHADREIPGKVNIEIEEMKGGEMRNSDAAPPSLS